MAELNETGWFTDDVATFGDRLAAAREARGLSHEDLAERLGVKSQTIREWENDRWEPRANRMQMLAGMLSVSLGWLMAGVGLGIAPPNEEAKDKADLVAAQADLLRLKSQVQVLNATVERVERRIAGQIGEEVA